MCVGGGDGGAVGAVHPLFWVACYFYSKTMRLATAGQCCGLTCLALHTHHYGSASHSILRAGLTRIKSYSFACTSVCLFI